MCQLLLKSRYGGNLIINVSNQSDIDTAYIDLYIDGKKVISDRYTNTMFHGYKQSVLKVKRGRHSLKLIECSKNISKEIQFARLFIKWITIDYIDNHISDFDTKQLTPYNTDSIKSSVTNENYKFIVSYQNRPFFIE